MGLLLMCALFDCTLTNARHCRPVMRKFGQMENLLEMAAEPVMTDMGIRVGTAGTTVLLSHPSPVPDLYRGQPIVFTATLAGGTGDNGDDGAFGEHSRRQQRVGLLWLATLGVALTHEPPPPGSSPLHCRQL